MSVPSILALTCGTSLSALTAALMKKPMRPSLVPYLSRKEALNCLRSSMTALMSHSLKVVRMAAWCWTCASRAAMVRRRGLMGFLMKRGAACSGPADCFSRSVSDGSCACSGSSSGGDAAFFTSGCGVFSGSGSTVASSFSGTEVPADGAMRPRTAPMGASAPSGTRISSMPSSSASRSVETLSVSSVTRVSPLATASPEPLCHAATVAAVMDSPKLGIRMSLMGW